MSGPTTYGGGSPVTFTVDEAQRRWAHKILPKTYLTLPPAASGLDTPCRVWAGFRSAWGYGQVRVTDLDGKTRNAKVHRVALQAHLGRPLPPPSRHATVDHLCGNPACCEPEHLELVTQRENNLRGSTVAAAHAAKTHCPAGHAYAGDNLYLYSDGRRKCRECDRQRNRAYRARQKAQAAA